MIKLEELYFAPFPNGKEEAVYKIRAVLCAVEEERLRVFILTLRKRGQSEGLVLFQYLPQIKAVKTIAEENCRLAQQLLEIFERALFLPDEEKTVELPGEKREEAEIPGKAVLICHGRQLAVKGAAIAYMGQRVCGASWEKSSPAFFKTLHHHDKFQLRLRNDFIQAETIGSCFVSTRRGDLFYHLYYNEEAYRLERTFSKYINAYQFFQPFQLMKFIAKQASPDLQMEIENYEQQKIGKSFIGVRLLRNFILEEEENIYIGDAAIAGEFPFRGEIPKGFSPENGRGAYLWLETRAEDLADAFQKLNEGLECVTGIVNLFVKNDSFMPDFWTENRVAEWHYALHENIVDMSDEIYIENCDTGEAVYYGGTDYKKNVVCLEESVKAYLEEDNSLDKMFNLFVDKTGERAFLLMLRWFQAGCAAQSGDEKIIYMDMALEFCMSGEQGIPFWKNQGIEEEKQKRLLARLEQVLEEGELSEEQQKSTKQQLRNTLIRNASFISKLECFIKKEKLDICGEELALIQKMRKKRNAIAHGKKSASLSHREMEIVTGITSRLLLAKVRKVVQKYECN